MSTRLTSLADAFLARFEGLKKQLPGNASVRAEAAELFRSLGLPHVRQEAWRYTNLRPLAETTFHEPLTALTDGAALLARAPALDAPRLVFVNGHLNGDLSTAESTDALRIGEMPTTPALMPRDAPMVALNAMLTEDGTQISAVGDAGTLMLVSLGTDAAGHAVDFHLHHRIHVAAGARLTLLEVSVGRGVYLNNPVVEVDVEEGGHFTHVRLQQDAEAGFHLATVLGQVAGKATYDFFTLNLGARLSRTEVRMRITGPDSIVHLNGAQILGGHQHGDITTIVSHDAPDCASRQTVKNVLGGQSRGVFQGKIEVARAAQKTDGYQMNQALLLSPDAEINCKPQLEIYADDVKCSHGATVGELDADQMFYLRSRGVPAEEARNILIRAFLTEALDEVKDDAIRAVLEHALSERWERQAA